MPLPLIAMAAGAAGSLISNYAEQGANKKRQGIVNQGLASQQGYRNDMVNALAGTLNNGASINQHTANRTQAVSNAIGNAPRSANYAGAPKAYQTGQARMALGNAQRKTALAQALGGAQGFQSANFQDGIGRSQLGTELGGINRQASNQLFQDSQRINAVRPNAGLQFVGEGLKLGAALGGVL